MNTNNSIYESGNSSRNSEIDKIIYKSIYDHWQKLGASEENVNHQN